MNSKVKVCADQNGLVVVPSQNNPEWGHIRVEQSRIVIDDNGFARTRKLSALIPGTIKDLQCFGWKANQEIPGAVYYKESLIPFNPKDPERDYKRAGTTNVVCCVEGQPIYRKNFYSVNTNAVDQPLRDEVTGEIITHDNKEDIRAAYRELTNVTSEEGLDKV